MFMRRRPLLRAAAVGGGAYMAGKHMQRRAQDREYAEAGQERREDRVGLLAALRRVLSPPYRSSTREGVHSYRASTLRHRRPARERRPAGGPIPNGRT